MKNNFVFIALVCCMSPSVVAQSDESRPLWPVWGGSSQDETQWGNSKESSVFNSPSKGELFRLPQWTAPRWSTPDWPSVPGFSGIRKQTSRSLKSARYTTRRWWNGTKNLLMPYPVDESDVSTEQPSSGFWWFGRRQEDPEIATVNDFLRQERPRF